MLMAIPSTPSPEMPSALPTPLARLIAGFPKPTVRNAHCNQHITALFTFLPTSLCLLHCFKMNVQLFGYGMIFFLLVIVVILKTTNSLRPFQRTLFILIIVELIYSTNFIMKKNLEEPESIRLLRINDMSIEYALVIVLNDVALVNEHGPEYKSSINLICYAIMFLIGTLQYFGLPPDPHTVTSFLTIFNTVVYFLAAFFFHKNSGVPAKFLMFTVHRAYFFYLEVCGGYPSIDLFVMARLGQIIWLAGGIIAVLAEAKMREIRNW